MGKMGDAWRIDHLRALALSSMPSLARRPAQRQHSGAHDGVEQRKILVSAPPVIVSDDKEEGELSSDDEIERAATPLAAVESSFSLTHRNAGQSLPAPPQEKEERHTFATTSAYSVPLVGVTTSSVFSTSTRVSIVNKSQLFSAFTAQAPPLISSQTPEAVHIGSGAGIAARQCSTDALSEVNSVGPLLDNLVGIPYQGPSGKSLQASSTVGSQLVLDRPNSSRSHATGNGRSGETITQIPSTAGSAGTHTRKPVPSSTRPGLRLPDPPTPVAAVTRAISAVPISVTATAGGDVSTASGTAAAVSHSAIPVTGGAGRKDVEAFLASLRIPLPNSAGCVDGKKEAFLIKFDEDSESDGEDENRTDFNRRHQGKGSQKAKTSKVGPMIASLSLQSNPVMQTQSPADLTAEIDRMKKQIAEKERSQGKITMPPILVKAGKGLPADSHRNVFTSVTESRPSNHVAAANIRPASIDLENMRLRIAAKESELQERRQRLAVKIPENARGVRDAKRIGDVLSSSLPSSKKSQAGDSAIAHGGNTIGKSALEMGTPGFTKEVQARADDIPALALAGPVGAIPASFKKDGVDGSMDLRHLNVVVSNFAPAQVGPHVDRMSHQPGFKGMKRSRSVEGRELAKAPKRDKDSVPEKYLAQEFSKEATLRSDANDSLKDGRRSSSSVQTAKRKLDAQTSSDNVRQRCLLDRVSAAGSEPGKKLKTDTVGELIKSDHRSGAELPLSSKQYVALDSLSKDMLLLNSSPREMMKSTFPGSNCSLLGTGLTSDIDGKIGTQNEEPTMPLSAPFPTLSERQRSSVVLTSSSPIQQSSDITLNAEALQIQQATNGQETSYIHPSTVESAFFNQPNVLTSEIQQIPTCTTVAVSQQGTSGRLNQNDTFSIENKRAEKFRPRLLVNPVSAHSDYQVEDFLHPGHSGMDKQHLGGEQVIFQHLLDEEELLDKQLEEVQRIRQQCEVRERIARREYREAQWALRAANADCHSLNQRKESLLSQIHTAEALHLSGKSFVHRPSVPLGRTVVTQNHNRPQLRPLLVSAPYSLPVTQAVSFVEDVNVDQSRSALVCENLSPLSSDRVDLAALPDRDAKSVSLADVGEQISPYKMENNISSDGKEQESGGQQILQADPSGRLKNGSAVGAKKVEFGFVNARRMVVLETGVFMDGTSQAANQYVCSDGDLKNYGSGDSLSTDIDTVGPGVSNFSMEGEHYAVSMTHASHTKVDKIPSSTTLEESEEVPLKSLSLNTVDCSKQTACSVDGISIDGSKMIGLSAVCQEDKNYPVTAQEQVRRLESALVTGKDLEQEGRVKHHHDVKHGAPSNSSEEARSVDCLQSAADLVQDLETTDLHKFVGVRDDGNVDVDGTTQDDSTGNVSSEIYTHFVPIHFKDCTSGISAVEFADAGCHVQGRFPDMQDVVAGFVSKECAAQVLPERSSSVQETVLLDDGTQTLESSAIVRVYAKNGPLERAGELFLVSSSHPLLEASGTRDEFERDNVKSSDEMADNNARLVTERQQCCSHLSPSTINTLGDEETDLNDVDRTHTGSRDAARLDSDKEDLTMPSSQEAPSQSDVRKAHTIDESSEQEVSAMLFHGNSITDNPMVSDVRMQLARAMESPEIVPQVHSVPRDVESENGADGQQKVKPRSSICSLEYEVNRDVWREVCLEGAEQTDFVVGNLPAESPGTINHARQDLWIAQNHLFSSSIEDKNRHHECYSVTELADCKNLDRTGNQGSSESSEGQQLDRFDLPPQQNFNMTFDANSITVASDDRMEDRVQEEVIDLCRSTAPEMIADDCEVSNENELGIRTLNSGMAVLAEDEQEVEVIAGISVCGEQKQEDSENKASKGADIEVFRKALLDENMFERRSISAEAADATIVRKHNRNEVSNQVLPQLQQHRLDHLLDMVEVRVPELSVGGEILAQQCLRGEKYFSSPVAVDDLRLDTLAVESHDIVGPSSEQALSSRLTSEHGRWVPSATSLAVLRFIPTVQILETDSGDDKGKVSSKLASEHSFGSCVVPPYRFESSLSIFHSYRFCPQLSGNLPLQRNSITWSHAINPFKPLCKFEHRGKCNNDDCPWQHADDYTLTSDDQDGAAKFLVKDTDTACVSVPIQDVPEKATVAKAWLAGTGNSMPKSSMGPFFLPVKWNDIEVPVYRTGLYVLRAEDPKIMCLLSHSLQLDRELDSSHFFLLSPSIHRPLPLDIPCLLDASESPSSSGEAPAYHPGSPHWRYVRDTPEKLTCSKDGFEFQELIDEEQWIEMALHHIEYDLSTDNNKARDQALFYLSRALESKQSSVTLWAVYACLFHTRRDNSETDDMFHHAVQYNPGSYELWVLYINSRVEYLSRLEAYEKSIVALADEGTPQQLDKEELSACLLDLGLRMLYFWCVSGCSDDSILWVDDRICVASGQTYARSERRSSRILLSYLTQHDACVMWIACAYLVACKQLPNSIITRLGCTQELPYGLKWEKHAKLDELSRKLVVKVLSTAASEGLGCLSLGSAESLADGDNFSKQILGVNFIQCLALYEGLDSAASLGKRLISLHPNSLELIVVCARIDEHCIGVTTGLNSFEAAVSQWPHDLPGLQRLWNQYAGHALLWGGKDLAKVVLSNCVATKKLPPITEEEVSQLLDTETGLSVVNSGKTKRTDSDGNADESWSYLRDYFVRLTSVCKRSEGRTSNCQSSHHLFHVEDTVFAWINLALVEALIGDVGATQSAINSATKAAISHQDLRHCWKELAAQHVLCRDFAKWEDSKFLERGLLSLLDRCKTDSYNLSLLRPLCSTAFRNYKKPHVRNFLEDLLGPTPVDNSILNTTLETLYGPQMLPSGSYPLKEVFRFAEGILEATPGNVQLASSLCKYVCENRSILKRTYMPAFMWASALLISSLHQACPVAPEIYWVEAGSLLRQLDEGRSVEEYYRLALLRYPFSSALRQCLGEVQNQLLVTDKVSAVVYDRSLDLVVSEPKQVAVEC